MSSLESNLQGMVHSIEHGGVAKYVKWACVSVAIAALCLLYLLVEFKGLSEPVAMDQAQIARNLARGQGFTTNYIRPLALWQFQKNGLDIPKVSMPDTYNSPLFPAFNALLLKPIQSRWIMKQGELIYIGDRLIAAGGIVCFLLSVGILFMTAWRIFDFRLAAMSSALILLCDMFWQFSLSGLPQMFMLLLFSAAMYCMLRSIQAAYESTPVGLWLSAAGLLFGLLTLTHGLAFWIFLGALLFTVIFFQPRFISGLLLLGFFTLAVGPWIARNYAVSGSPFGVGIYSALDGVRFSESGWMRQSEPDFNALNPRVARTELIDRLKEQFNRLFEWLGWSVVAPVFFLSLLHTFRRKDASAMRWLLFSMWVPAVLGMIFFGMQEASLEANQLHVLFAPLMTVFGLAFILVLWSRLPIDYVVVRIAFLSLLFILCALPTLFRLLPSGGKIHWPPYVPPFIAILGEWTDPNEIIASDMPWGVAWYADRKSLLLPKSPKDLTRFHDFEILGGPINGLYLTPISGNKPLFMDIIKGEYKEWASFILRSPSTEDGFHLTAGVPLPVENECIFYSDRDRWSKGGIDVPESIEPKDKQGAEGK